MSTPSRTSAAYDGEMELSQADPLPYHQSHPNYQPLIKAFPSVQALLDSDTSPLYFERCFLATLEEDEGEEGRTLTRLDMSKVRRDCNLTPRIISALLACNPSIAHLDVTNQPWSLNLQPLEPLLRSAKHVNLGRNAIGLSPGALRSMSSLEFYAREAWDQDRSAEYGAFRSDSHPNLRVLHLLGGTVSPITLANFMVDPPRSLRVARIHCPPSEVEARGGSTLTFGDHVLRLFDPSRGAYELERLYLFHLNGEWAPHWRDVEAVRQELNSSVLGGFRKPLIAVETYSTRYSRGTRKLLRFDNGQTYKRRELKVEDELRLVRDTQRYLSEGATSPSTRTSLAFDGPADPAIRGRIPREFRALRTLVLRNQSAALEVASLLSLPQLRIVDLSGSELGVTLGKLDRASLASTSRELSAVILNDSPWVNVAVLEAVALSPNLSILAAERFPQTVKKGGEQGSLDGLLSQLTRSTTLTELYLRNQGVVTSQVVLEAFLGSVPTLRILHLDHPLSPAQLAMFKRAHPGLLEYVCISPKVNLMVDEDAERPEHSRTMTELPA